MANKMKLMLVLLLIIQKTAGWTTPSMACDGNCGGDCNCRGRGLTSVPQHLPTDITRLDLSYNNITTLSQSDFSRYSSLTALSLNNNGITSIKADVFVNLPQLETLSLSHNSLTTISLTVYDTLVSIGVDLSNNPWQCDCRMLPIKRGMTGFRYSDERFRCAGPANLEGKSLLLAVEPEDLNCEDTGSSPGGSADGSSPDKMPNKMKKMLVLLLIILKDVGLTPACSSSCSSYCECRYMSLTTVPQDLPTYITELYLSNNALTTLNQSDFSRYSNLLFLYLQSNQISEINSGAFCNLTSLAFLYINNNQLTSLTADMFMGLNNLLLLFLNNNTISTIAAGAFINLQRIRSLDLSQNHIDTFPTEALSNLNSSMLQLVDLSYNQMETLPPTAYDILAANSVDISNNPWQCDCRMLPFKQRMTSFPAFEKQIICAEPSNLSGKSLLYAVYPDDLICEETSTSSSVPADGIGTSPDSFADGTSPDGSVDGTVSDGYADGRWGKQTLPYKGVPTRWYINGDLTRLQQYTINNKGGKMAF
uniref:LRRCT domain-containing protein n=1 Tax=Branchiostoma floridae TaxID=7739 RepID=C3ZQ54_BRAFL|eukprot:XP_002589422.1 hypothetical protein BRAFLDRAFT_77868 [Branchiostoma floridae]